MKLLVPYRLEQARKRGIVRDRIVRWLQSSDIGNLTLAFECFKYYNEKCREHEEYLRE